MNFNPFGRCFARTERARPSGTTTSIQQIAAPANGDSSRDRDQVGDQTRCRICGAVSRATLWASLTARANDFRCPNEVRGSRLRTPPNRKRYHDGTSGGFPLGVPAKLVRVHYPGVHLRPLVSYGKLSRGRLGQLGNGYMRAMAPMGGCTRPRSAGQHSVDFTRPRRGARLRQRR